MTDRRVPRNTGDDGGVEYERESTTGIPRWAKIVGIIVAVVALLIIVMLLVGGGSGHNRPGVDVNGAAFREAQAACRAG